MSKLYEEIFKTLDEKLSAQDECDYDVDIHGLYAASEAIEKICIKEQHAMLLKFKEAPKEQWERMVNVGLEELQKQLEQ